MLEAVFSLALSRVAQPLVSRPGRLVTSVRGLPQPKPKSKEPGPAAHFEMIEVLQAFETTRFRAYNQVFVTPVNPLLCMR
jgi:hypothetical protein